MRHLLRHLQTLAVALTVATGSLLQSGYVTRCVGDDGHRGVEIVHAEHGHHDHDHGHDEQERADGATPAGGGCTDTVLPAPDLASPRNTTWGLATTADFAFWAWRRGSSRSSGGPLDRDVRPSPELLTIRTVVQLI